MIGRVRQCDKLELALVGFGLSLGFRVEFGQTALASPYFDLPEHFQLDFGILTKWAVLSRTSCHEKPKVEIREIRGNEKRQSVLPLRATQKRKVEIRGNEKRHPALAFRGTQHAK
jgi:hypothetical protein